LADYYAELIQQHILMSANGNRPPPGPEAGTPKSKVGDGRPGERLVGSMPGENAMQPREAPGPNGTAVAADTLEQAHRELENLLARYRDLFELASDGYVVTDRTGVIQDVNRAVVQALETRKEFLVGKPLPFLAVPDRRPELFKLLGRLNLT